MSNERLHTWGGRALTALAAVLVLALANPAWAQEEADAPMSEEMMEPAMDGGMADDPVNQGNVSVTLGFDITTQYWFRGISQENQGFIFQPYGEVGVSLFEFENVVDDQSVTIDWYIGIWNSLHTGPTGTGGGGNSAWFEADFYTGFSVGLPYNFGVDFSFISLNNPNGGGIFAEEFDLGVSYDASDALAEVVGNDMIGLELGALLAVEVDGGSDAGGITDENGVPLNDGGQQGTYLEFGITPSVNVVESESFPVSVAMPMTLGLSIENYYEGPSGADETFGFFDIGVEVGTDLTFIPAEYGAWSTYAGVHVILLGDTTEAIAETPGSEGGFGVTGGDIAEVYGVFGLEMAY